MPSLTTSDKAAVSQSIKQARLVEASRKLARIVKHVDPKPNTKAARTRTEKSLTKWMMYHGGQAFSSPFCDDHKRVIAKIEQAVNKGGMFAVAMPRGHGKSTILKWAVLYCLLTGRRKYVVVIAATAEYAQGMIEFCRRQIQESDSLHKHYPHVTAYARATDGKAIKAKFQLRADGKASGIEWSKSALVFPEIASPTGEGYPSNGAILEGHGLTGHIRGRWRDTRTGKTLRPDLVLLDDPQSRESAESDSQCRMRERIITGDVLGLAGPRKRIAAVMPCTIVRPGDLAARFLDHEQHPEWNGETCSLVKSWPDAQETLWTEYATIYKTDRKGATKFYAANRKAMDKGAKVSWKHRIRDGELSAIQTAENLRIETGDEFWAEYMNKPLKRSYSAYMLTPELVESRADPARAPGIIPQWTYRLIAATDVNPSYGLSTAVFAFGKDQLAAVLWYGVYRGAPLPVRKEMTESEARKRIYEALAAHGKQLAGMPCRPNAWIIDGGGSPQGTVIDLAANAPRICGLEAACAFGRASRQYRPTGKHRIIPGEQLHRVVERRDKQWIIFNADYWREVAQKAWTGSPGSPGSCSLPKGRHEDFAMQICREQLAGKDEVGGRTIWVWDTAPGPHDFGDCMAMGYMGAALMGIGTGGAQVRAPVRRRRTGVTAIPL